MQTLTDRAAGVAARIENKQKTVGFGITLIITIIGVIINAIRLWQDCKKIHPDPQAAARRAGLWFRHKVKKSAQAELRAQGLDEGLADEVRDECLAEIAGMSNAEVMMVVQEVESLPGILK